MNQSIKNPGSLFHRVQLTEAELAILGQHPRHPLHILLIRLFLKQGGQGEAEETEDRGPEDEGHGYLGVFRVVILEDAVDKRA